MKKVPTSRSLYVKSCELVCYNATFANSYYTESGLAWTIKEELKKRAFEMLCYRRMLKISWLITNVIALIKPRKPANDTKSYRPIALLSCIYKLLENLSAFRIGPLQKRVTLRCPLPYT